MDYLQNHIWCRDSNWGGHYDCRHMVSLHSYKEGYMEDWGRLIEEKDYYNEDSDDVKRVMTFFESKGIPFDKSEMCTKKISTLQDEIFSWLRTNVKAGRSQEGWCVGSDRYVSTDSGSSYSIFFQRKVDAINFIKRWSVWGKPVNYCQYFTDVRKVLNLETGKYTES